MRMGRGPRQRVVRPALMALMLAAYVGAGLYAHLVLGANIAFTHLAYIPIVFAGMWWGRRAVLVAGLLAAVSFGFRGLDQGVGPLWADLVRAAFFFLVAFSVGTLREQVARFYAALRTSEEKYRLIIENSLAGIFLYRDERVLFANPRFCAMLGYRPDEVVGRSIWELIDAADQPRVRALVAKRKAEGSRDLRYECRYDRADGRVIWADVASSVADYEGQPAVLVNVYDINDRKEAEEKRRELAELARRQEDLLIHSTRLAELGEMAAAVAHELNQPLTGIRNFARNAFYMLDQAAGSPEEVKENLRLISDQVDRAARIINQMRELTRRTERQFSRVSINAVLRESVEFLLPQMRLAGVEPALDLAPDLPDVMGDRIRLEQVFLNLLTNARQAMEESETRRLVVRTRLENAADGAAVVIEVSDTGKGFSDEQAARLFTPFFSTKQPGQGTGLGLSISLRIVKDHQGTIRAAGQPGKGATFTVRLPAAPEAAE